MMNSVSRMRLVIVGNGMATGRLLDELALSGGLARYEVVVFGEEHHGQYNRVLLSNVLGGKDASSILMKSAAWYAERGVRFHRGVRAQRLDLERRRVIGNNGVSERFDRLVLATGSRAAMPPIPGTRCDDTLLEGVFLFRTIDDALAIRGSASEGKPAVVLGGGLLGLEAAKGLSDQGMNVTVVDRGRAPLSKQLDEEGGRVLLEHLAGHGISFLGSRGVTEVRGNGRIESVVLDNGNVLPACLLVVACGIQPRAELAVSAGIPVHRAIVVDDQMRIPSFEGLFAIGECAEHRGEVYGVVSPIFEQVTVVAKLLLDPNSRAVFAPKQVYTRLKVAGIDAASLGDLEAHEGDEVIVIRERQKGTFRRVIVRMGRVVGAQCVGDLRAVPNLISMWQRGEPAPHHLVDLFSSDDWDRGQRDCGDEEICSCHSVKRGTILSAVHAGCRSIESIGQRTRAGTGCGSCRGELVRIIGQRSATGPGTEVDVEDCPQAV